jgi:hypothetical protein
MEPNFIHRITQQLQWKVFSVNSTSLFQNPMSNIDKPERKVPSRAATLGRQRDNGPGARYALSPENQQMNNRMPIFYQPDSTHA